MELQNETLAEKYIGCLDLSDETSIRCNRGNFSETHLPIYDFLISKGFNPIANLIRLGIKANINKKLVLSKKWIKIDAIYCDNLVAEVDFNGCDSVNLIMNL